MATHLDLYYERNFQDKLYRLGLITRRGYAPKDAGMLQPNTKESKLLAILIENPGYIIPYLFLSDHLYGSNQNEMKRIGRVVTELKYKRAIDGWDVFALPGFGIGVGIDSIGFTTKQMELFRLLWGRQKYTCEQIHQALWGVFGPSEPEELFKVRTLIDTTRDLLSHTPYTIVRSGEWRQYRYSLQEVEE